MRGRHDQVSVNRARTRLAELLHVNSAEDFGPDETTARGARQAAANDMPAGLHSNSATLASKQRQTRTTGSRTGPCRITLTPTDATVQLVARAPDRRSPKLRTELIATKKTDLRSFDGDAWRSRRSQAIAATSATIMKCNGPTPIDVRCPPRRLRHGSRLPRQRSGLCKSFRDTFGENARSMTTRVALAA